MPSVSFRRCRDVCDDEAVLLIDADRAAFIGASREDDATGTGGRKRALRVRTDMLWSRASIWVLMRGDTVVVRPVPLAGRDLTESRGRLVN